MLLLNEKADVDYLKTARYLIKGLIKLIQKLLNNYHTIKTNQYQPSNKYIPIKHAHNNRINKCYKTNNCIQLILLNHYPYLN